MHAPFLLENLISAAGILALVALFIYLIVTLVRRFRRRRRLKVHEEPNKKSE